MTRGAVCALALVLILSIQPAARCGEPAGSSPSVDRLNIEDFEPKAGSPRPKPGPRPKPAGRGAKPAAGETKETTNNRTTPTPGELWREPATGLDFVWIPAGCFEMGSPTQDMERQDDEAPVHQVCVDGFWMGRTEVTVGALKRFADAANFLTDSEREGFAWYWNGKEWAKRSGVSFRSAGFRQTDDHPAVNVSLDDAKAMAEWLSRQGRGAFRLPSEAEWEYACRAGAKTTRFWGDSPSEACRHGNVGDSTGKREMPAIAPHDCDDGYAYTSPVGSYPANGFGLVDMLGNVWEWCEDLYTRDAYTKHQGKNPIVTTGGAERAIRGGSYYERPAVTRCARRSSRPPDLRSAGLGFRLVRTN